MWEKTVNKDIIGYNIYRRAVTDQVFNKINKEIINRLSYTEKEQLETNKYFYKVTAVDRFGNESLFSKETLLDIRE